MGAKEELTIVIILGIMYLLTIITNKDQLRFRRRKGHGVFAHQDHTLGTRTSNSLSK